ncbi:MAG TPA: ubiquinol-cytochrome c reductase iron-sulfur subunit [Acidobacteriaceae bacterium]|nr:ubiquinol-cytochrome c reductase iron-sulfur subunit [Acidobacteriaceae bacterium]
MEQQEKVQENVTNKDVIVINRRSFFAVLLGIGTAGMGALLAIPVLRYVLSPLYAKSKEGGWSLVGPMEEFSNLDQPIAKRVTLTQLDGWREVVSPQSVYVTLGPDKQLRVLSAICPHLGCSVGWHKNADEFVCPCHGGRFAPDGKHVFGPPPRGMDPLPHKVEDGKLMVHFEYFREDVPNREKLS